MKTPSRKHRALLASCLFLGLGLLPAVVMWREWRQTRLDSALIVAVKRRDTSAAVARLREGAHANARDTGDAPSSWWQSLQHLFYRRNATSKHPQTALLLVVQGVPGEGPPPENVPLAQALLERGASMDAVDENDMTALMSASIYGHLATVKLLLDRGADTRPKDKGFTIMVSGHGRTGPVPIAGRTALQYAFEMNDDTAIMRLLLDHGADLNVRDGYGATLLISAAGRGATEKVRLLLSRKADLHPRDQWGRTALMQARSNHDADIVKLLQKAGANE